MVFQGMADKLVFRAYVKEVLSPKLRPGDVLVLDNLSLHHDKEAQNLIQATGARIEYLPTYSPDLNPIEECFSKLKAFVKAYSKTSIEELVELLVKAFDRVTLQNIWGWFKHAGVVY